MITKSRGVRIQLTIVLMCAALLMYLALLGRTAVLMIGSTRCVPNWTAIPMIGGVGIGWPAPMTTPVTVVVPEKP